MNSLRTCGECMDRIFCSRTRIAFKYFNAVEALCVASFTTTVNVGQRRDLARKPVANEDASSTATAIDPKAKISRAMRVYMERAQAHNMFMKQLSNEFEIGKRHLANMMGEDPETFSQTDINKAIQYLFPSNLSDLNSRPLMMPPEEIFPEQKEAQFGLDGRPFHPFFYMRHPNYFQALHDIVKNLEELNALEDERIKKGKPFPTETLNLTGTRWMTPVELGKSLLEMINKIKHAELLSALEKAMLHPYAYRLQDFILKFRVPLSGKSVEAQIPDIKQDEAGRRYCEAYGSRKTSHAWVMLKEGTGKIDVNGQDILYFPRIQNREQIMFPFQFLDKMFQFDLRAKVDLGGYSSQAGAIREAVSRCLTAFVSQEEAELMRQAGLLTHDWRVKERKKYAFKGARAKPIWRKR